MVTTVTTPTERSHTFRLVRGMVMTLTVPRDRSELVISSAAWPALPPGSGGVCSASAHVGRAVAARMLRQARHWPN